MDEQQIKDGLHWTEGDPPPEWFCATKLRAPEEGGHTLCRRRAGWGTDHPGVGRCRYHLGTVRNHRTHARLQLAQLVPAAIATLADILADSDISPATRRAVAADVLDRTGYPKRQEMSVEVGAETLAARIEQALAEQDDEPV